MSLTAYAKALELACELDDFYYTWDYYDYMDEIKGQLLETDKAKNILDEKALWSGVLSF